MRTVTIRLSLTAACLAAAALHAHAQEARPATREIRGQIGASINNAGLQNTLELSWTRRAISAGIVHGLTPAQTRLGGWLQVSPAPMFDLRAGVDPSLYFGTFNSLQGFDAYDNAFDKDARDARAGAKTGYSVRAYVAPTLKMKAGPIVASVTGELEFWRSNAAAPYFYEPTRDTLLKSSGDRLLATTSVVMYRRTVGEGALSAGAIHTTVRVFDAGANDVRKLGAIVVREFSGTHFRLPRPRITVIAAKYLDDPAKQGQWTAAAAIGFRATRSAAR